MAHHESGPFRIRKCGKRLFHLFAQLETLRQSFGVWRIVRNTIHGIVFHSVRASGAGRFSPRVFFLLLAHAVNGVVGRDAIDPSSEVCARFELTEFLIRSQKRLLDNFFRILLVPGHAVGQPKNILAVPLDENAKGIALAREGALDGEGVACGDGLGILDALLHPIH